MAPRTHPPPDILQYICRVNAVYPCISHYPNIPKLPSTSVTEAQHHSMLQHLHRDFVVVYKLYRILMVWYNTYTEILWCCTKCAVYLWCSRVVVLYKLYRIVMMWYNTYTEILWCCAKCAKYFYGVVGLWCCTRCTEYLWCGRVTGGGLLCPKSDRSEVGKLVTPLPLSTRWA